MKKFIPWDERTPEQIEQLKRMIAKAKEHPFQLGQIKKNEEIPPELTDEDRTYLYGPDAPIAILDPKYILEEDDEEPPNK